MSYMVFDLWKKKKQIRGIVFTANWDIVSETKNGDRKYLHITGLFYTLLLRTYKHFGKQGGCCWKCFEVIYLCDRS